MNGDDQARVDSILDRWEDAADTGLSLTAELLCQDCPELLPEVSRQIRLLNATGWMLSGTGPDPVEIRSPNDTTASDVHRRSQTRPKERNRPESDSRLMNADELTELRETLAAQNADDSRTQVSELINSGRLTEWQGSVLLSAPDQPLVVDRYVLLDVLGSGGMGVVYKAQHRSMARMVALKMLSRELISSSDKTERFRREMRAAARLSHPNVVSFFDADESADTHFLAMEYVRGSNLAEVVRESGPLDVSRAIDCIIQAARGLQHAHDSGVVHRDVKPANLLVTDGGQVKVADMGLASLEPVEGFDSHADGLTGETILGTISYISPEQAADTNDADTRSDIYSLGATLHFLLTGRPPFHKRTTVKTLLAHREQPPPELCEARDGVSAELQAVFARMVAKEPNGRFQSMREVIDAISRVPIPSHSQPARVPATGPDSDTRPVAIASESTLSHPTLPPAPHGRNEKTLPTVPGRWWVIPAVLLLSGIVILIRKPDGSTERLQLAQGTSVTILDGSLKQSGSEAPSSPRPADGSSDAMHQHVFTKFIESGQKFGDSASSHVAVSDLDDDGDLDAWVTNQRKPNTVWFNDGTGQFTDSGQLLGKSDSRHFSLADLDSDGDVDAFVCNYQGQPNRVWINDGTGQFVSNGQELGDSDSRDVALSDFDGDGDIDAFVVNKGQPNKVWMNDGAGMFTDSGQSLGEFDSRGVEAADLDDDGDIDVFVVNGGNDFTGDPNRVWLNDGNGTFRDSGRAYGDNWSLSVCLGDLDADGDLDAFVGNTIGRPANTVWLNDGSGRFFDSGQRLGDFHTQNVLLHDLDDDGDLDAFVSNIQASRIWINNGHAVFDQFIYPGGGSAMTTALGDLDGDGDLDAFEAKVGYVPNRVLFGEPSVIEAHPDPTP